MTIEKDIYVCLKEDGRDANEVAMLFKKAQASLGRAEKLLPGDRTEAIRYEALHTAIDRISIKVMLENEKAVTVINDSPNVAKTAACVLTKELTDMQGIPPEVQKWINRGDIVVRMTLPHFEGKISTNLSGQTRSVMERWDVAEKTKDVRSITKDVRSILQKRFEDMVEKALDGVAEGGIQPTGVQNSVLTEGLWKYVLRKEKEPLREIPVLYRDGSQGPIFPLRSLNLVEEPPKLAGTKWTKFRFALMSMRHVELDAEVDGAWLRNVKISQQRAAGLTDQIVFETSLRQFGMLTQKFKNAEIYLYQTGLEPAIIGFYRAFVYHMKKYPGSLVIRPMYYRENADFKKGKVWAII